MKKKQSPDGSIIMDGSIMLRAALWNTFAEWWINDSFEQWLAAQPSPTSSAAEALTAWAGEVEKKRDLMLRGLFGEGAEMSLDARQCFGACMVELKARYMARAYAIEKRQAIITESA